MIHQRRVSRRLFRGKRRSGDSVPASAFEIKQQLDKRNSLEKRIFRGHEKARAARLRPPRMTSVAPPTFFSASTISRRDIDEGRGKFGNPLS